MKAIRITTAILMICYMLLTNVSPALAVPPQPSSFYGTVKVDGANVPIGTLVTAWINGIQYASFPASTFLTDTIYYFDVPGDDLSTPSVIEGGVQGQTITFHIGTLVAAQTGTWSQGTNVSLNLTAVSNLAPTDINLSPSSVAENLPTNTVVGALTSTDPDTGNTFTYSLVPGTGSADNASFNISGSNLRTSVIFNYEAGNSYSIRIRTTDQGGLFYEKAFTITILNVNEAPVLASIGNRSVAELVALTFTATATDEDVPAQTLTFSLVGAPTGATINGSTGFFTWTPTEAQGPGSYPFTVQVCDNAATPLCDTELITVTVSEVNVAPILAPIGNRSVAELSLLTFTASATDSDIPVQPLTFSLLSAPTGASINGSTGVFTWTPTEAQGPGSYPFTVQVCDNATTPLCDTELITVTVSEVNVAPILATIGNRSVAELTLLTFTATATDADLPAQTLTFSLLSAPTGASINASTGVFTWTPTEAQGPGSYPFTVRVCDNFTTPACDTEDITVTVSEVNVAPILANIGNRSVAELNLLTFTASATDSDIPVQPLTFSLLSAPTGASINASTGVFTWTPTEVQGGSDYTFTVQVCDNAATPLCDTELITVTVTKVNVAPVLDPIGNRSVAELSLLTFTATATDSDLPAQTLIFSLLSAPTGASINASTGVFTWTPTEAQGPGSYPFTVQVCDNFTTPLCDTELITVTVSEVNVAPVLAAIGPQSVAELSLLTFTATATDADLPAQTLTFSLIGAPTGASINASTGVFTWTPTEAQGPGSYPFTVQVCDNATTPLCDTELITVTVSEVNVAPILAIIGNRSVAELALITFTATATDADLPAQTLTFSLIGAPTGASINASTGVFTWTPTEAQGPGSYPFTVRVCDNFTTPACDTEDITVTVSEVNVAPVLAAIGPQSVAELSLLTFTASATDSDIPVQPLTFSLLSAPTGASINASTGVFTWTPTEAQGPGSYPFTVRVCDNFTTPACDTEDITVTVSEVNVAPILANIGNRSVAELNLLTFTASATDSDIPVQPLTFSLLSAPTGASINASTGVFTWTPTEVQGGSDYTFTVQVCDNAATPLCDTELITVTVTKVNVAPVLDPIGNRSVAELSLLTFTATATDSDLPAQTLIFSLLSAPTGASINASTGVFTWTPTEAQGPGSYPFTVQVCDNFTTPLCDTELITVTVSEVNVAPVLAAIGPQSVAELSLLTFTATATDSDIPVQPLTFSLLSAPTGASINASTGVFTWTPTEAQGPGSYPFTVQVCDNATTPLCDTELITVTVSEVNVAPILAIIGNRSVAELALITFTATATDADLPAQTLTFSLIGAPTGASINASTGVFTWTPTEAQGPGSYPFTVRVCDNFTTPACDTEDITVTVSEVNVAPVLAAIGPQSVAELSLLTFTASATDSDIPVQPLTFSLLSAPTGASINSLTGVFTWTPTEAQGPGSYPFTVQVCDNFTTPACDTEDITVTVSEVNVAPVLGTIGNRSVAELSLLTFTATATDADLPAQTLTFSLIGAPTGASINSLTGVFTWTPTEAQGPGSYPFTVRVCDNFTTPACDTEDITVTVSEVNVAPVLGTIGNRSVAELSLLTFTATATDADLPAQTLTFSLIGAPTGASINASTGVFTWTPTEAQGPGSYPFTVQVCDNFTTPACDTEDITVTVSEVNVAPVLGTIGNRSINELALLTFTATATDADLPAQTLTFSLIGAPTGASINSLTGVFTWTPTEAQGPGSYPFTVRVCDNFTTPACDTEDITVTVSEVNVAPILATIGNRSINELALLTFTATATDADLPTQTLTFSLIGAPTGASINGSTGVFTWTPTEAQGPGSYPFTVQVCDNFTTPACDTEDITVTVSEVNVAPVLGTIGNRSVAELSLLTFTATATDADLPAQTLTFSLIGAPTGASITASTGVFTWTPTEAQGPGSYPFTVRVCDNFTTPACDTEDITVTVSEVNVAPVLGTIGNRSINELALLTFTATATDADLPAQTLTFSLVGAPTGATINASTGVFTWTPTEAQGPGSYPFTVQVCDNFTTPACDTEDITVTVSEVNVAPVLAAIGPQSVAELSLLTFTASATDSDIPVQPLTFSLLSAPTGASINASTGVFTWTPTEAQGPGSYPFTVRVCDNFTTPACDTEDITVTVSEVNVAPVLGTIGNRSVAELSLLTFTVTATDADLPAQTLTFSLIGAPTGASINASTGVFTWTPTEAQGPGSYPFTVQVCDNFTTPACDTEDITVTVSEVNVAPVIIQTDPISVTMSVNGIPNPFSLTLNATDADLPANTLTWSILTQATHGTATAAGTGDSMLIGYTPLTDYIGSDSFVVQVSDGNGGTDTITVNVTISLVTYTISGTVGVSGASVAFTGGSPVLSDVGGAYSITVPYNWSGTVTPTLVGYTFTPPSRTYTNVQANSTDQDYVPTQVEYTLTVISAHGTVAKNPDQVTYHYGDSVQLTATPAIGWEFTSWSGDATSTANPVSVTIDGNMTVTANYTLIEYTLNVVSAHGTVAKNPDQVTYHYNDVVQLTAAPEAGWQFTGWSGDAAGTDNPVSITITGNMTVTANYAQIEYTLTIISAHGTVVVNPDQATYHLGDTVQLTATPDASWNFSSWSGDATGTDNPIIITITGDMTVTANYGTFPMWMPVIMR